MRDSVPGPDVVDDSQKWAVLGETNLERYRQALAKVAQPYTYYGDGEVLRTTYPPADFWASAGLVSTVRDLAMYDAAVDRHAFLGEEMQSRAWTPFLSNAGQPLAQGLGWYVTDYRGTRLVWHFGHWGTGFSAIYLKIPARRLTLVMLANSEALADHHFKVGEDITHNVFACSFIQTFVPESANERGESDLLTPAPASPTAPSTDCERTSRSALEKWIADRRAKARRIVPLEATLAAAYAGRYQFPSRIVTITREGSRLFIDFPQGGRTELFAESPTQLFLKIRPWTMTFVREGERVVRIDILESGEIVPAPRVDSVLASLRPHLAPHFSCGKFRRMHVDVSNASANCRDQLLEFPRRDALTDDRTLDHVRGLQSSCDFPGRRTTRRQSGWIGAGLGLAEKHAYRPVDRPLTDMDVCLLYVAFQTRIPELVSNRSGLVIDDGAETARSTRRDHGYLPDAGESGTNRFPGCDWQRCKQTTEQDQVSGYP